MHVSSDYVFDGTRRGTQRGRAVQLRWASTARRKAAGDAVVATVPRHYIVRTSWVIGEGNNFVRTMASLAERGVEPAVVDDQIGRLTFTDGHRRGHPAPARRPGAPFGTYNLSNDGDPQSWADIAADVFELSGAERSVVSGVTTAEYFKDKAAAPRPLNSVLDLTKIKATGFRPRNSKTALAEYLSTSQATV